MMWNRIRWVLRWRWRCRRRSRRVRCLWRSIWRRSTPYFSSLVITCCKYISAIGQSSFLIPETNRSYIMMAKVSKKSYSRRKPWIGSCTVRAILCHCACGIWNRRFLLLEILRREISSEPRIKIKAHLSNSKSGRSGFRSHLKIYWPHRGKSAQLNWLTNNQLRAWSRAKTRARWPICCWQRRSCPSIFLPTNRKNSNQQ